MIDLITSQPQYEAHALPVWTALPEGLRGEHGAARPDHRGDAALVAGFSDLRRVQAWGYRQIAYIEHGIGQSYSNGHSNYPGGRGRDAVGLFLSPNETAAAMDRAAYPAARVEVVGDPRLDTLPALEAEPGTVAISFHWQCAVAPETRSAFAHYRNVIPELAQAVPLIAHAHPRVAAEMRPFYRRLGIEFVETFDEVCRRASVFVADNTSCLYEFASTGRSVVVLNQPGYRRNVSHGLRFWDAATVGLQVNDPDRLIENVVYLLRDRRVLRQRRERALRIVYGFRSGAAERAADVITNWLRGLQAVAA